MKQRIKSGSWRTGRKKFSDRATKQKGLKKNEESLRQLQDNMKPNNIHIIGVPKGEKEEQGKENLFEKVITENFLNLMREKVM